MSGSKMLKYYNKLNIVPSVFSSRVLLTLGFLAGGWRDLCGLCLTSGSTLTSASVSLLGLTRVNTKLLPLAPLPTRSSLVLLNWAILSRDFSPRAMKEPRTVFPYRINVETVRHHFNRINLTVFCRG